MNTFINPEITIIKAKKNRNLGYYTELEKNNSDTLKIKSKSFSGRKRGQVGEILRDGSIRAPKEVTDLITPKIRKQIKMVIDLIYVSDTSKPTMKGKLVNYIRK